MNLRRLRNWFVECKIYFTRTYTYLNIFNFFMIALIFLNTTLWEYDISQKVFPDRKIFIFCGLIVVLLLTGLIGYLDTKFKIWRVETDRSLTAERNPAFIVFAFQCAKMLNDLKKQGKDVNAVEKRLDEIFERCDLEKELKLFKQQIK